MTAVSVKPIVKTASKAMTTPMTQAVPRLVLLALLFSFTLAACGQKGDLILPEDQKKAEQEKKKKTSLF